MRHTHFSLDRSPRTSSCTERVHCKFSAPSPCRGHARSGADALSLLSCYALRHWLRPILSVSKFCRRDLTKTSLPRTICCASSHSSAPLDGKGGWPYSEMDSKGKLEGTTGIFVDSIATVPHVDDDDINSIVFRKNELGGNEDFVMTIERRGNADIYMQGQDGA